MARWLPPAVIAIFSFLWFYLCAAATDRGIELRGLPLNAFFDMDITRVIRDWTTHLPSDRERVHPLYKLLALPVMGINETLYGGREPVAAVRLFCMATMAVQQACIGWLACKLTAGSWRWGAAAAALAAASFSSVLLASLPDAAAVSGVFSVLPMAILYARRGTALRWPEGLLWAIVGVGSFGITISQAFPFLFLFAVRLHWQPEEERTWKRHAQRFLLSVGIAAFVIGIGFPTQSALFPGSDRYYKINRIVARETKYMEWDELRAEPLQRVGRLLANAGLYAFAAPYPHVSRWSPPRDSAQFISISIVDTDFRTARTPVPWLLWAGLLVLFARALPVRRPAHSPPADAPPLWPLLLVAGGHLFVLHLVYGREHLIYSPNWHGLLCAAAVAGLWRRNGAWWWAPLALAAALAVNSYLVLGESMRLFVEEYPLEEAHRLADPRDVLPD